MYCELTKAKVKSREKNYTLLTGKNQQLMLEAAYKTRERTRRVKTEERT